MTIAGIVLAAGASRRMGSAKQLLEDNQGRPLVLRAVASLIDGGCDRVVVVTGAQRDLVAHAIATLGVIECFNPEWEQGMGTSIACAIRWLSAHADSSAVSACVIMACDMPSVTDTHIRRLVATSGAGQHRVASVYATDDGHAVHGVPAVLPRADWPALQRLHGDQGARALLRDPSTLSVPLVMGNLDLDTPADVARWRATSSSSLFTHPFMSIAQSALADLDHEFASTRRMLQLVPADHLDFTPHEKSWPLRRLANHLTDFPIWGTITLTQDVFDLAAPMPPSPPTPTSGEGFVAQLDERMVGFKQALAAATDAQMMETWTMKKGDHVIMSMPRVAVLRSSVISHMIHHRAQLSIYLRLLNVPVPGMYGPSADEQ